MVKIISEFEAAFAIETNLQQMPLRNQIRLLFVVDELKFNKVMRSHQNHKLSNLKRTDNDDAYSHFKKMHFKLETHSILRYVLICKTVFLNRCAATHKCAVDFFQVCRQIFKVRQNRSIFIIFT